MAKDDDSLEQRFPLRRPTSEPVEPARVRPATRTIKTPVFQVAPPPPPPPSTAKRLSAAARNWFEPFEPLELTGGMPPPMEVRGGGRGAPPPLELSPAMTGGYTTNLPVVMRPNRWRWFWRALAVLILLFIAAVAWLALTAPLSKSLQPIAPPSITLFAADGKTAIARRGAVIDKSVDAAKLPSYVGKAFMAIEDRRFESHWGVDPRGIMRAFVHNISGGGGSQGGSTITQQLAKNAFLTADRTATRKFQEVLIAFWLEAWLSKDEILSRYLSNVYFGDNVYGLRAASKHYFSCDPEKLTISQATLLAGLVQAPSRLAPTGNLQGARDRQKLVIAAMADAGFITKGEAAAVRPAVLKTDHVKQLPNGTYFADWVLPQARDSAGEIVTDKPVTTTLEIPVQKAAERAARMVGGRSQVAIVAMHPDGRVIAMVGGKNYGDSPFNRATQARRQPGSSFKLFVYLAALRSGMTPDTMVDDSPVSFGGWSPENSHRDYEGPITLRHAFAKSSNVVAARLIQQLGVARVTQAARDLGISTPIGDNASIALGTSTVSLLELTSAYASIAKGSYPVRPQGLDVREAPTDWLSRTLGGPTQFPNRTREDMEKLLSEVVTSGTGRAANLSVPTYGKTGTTQDNRDALFVGYAGEGDDAIVAGVWMGNDDNSPSPGLSGAGLPSRVWHQFMMQAMNLREAPKPVVVDDGNSTEGNGSIGLDDVLGGLGIDLGDGEVHTKVDTQGDDGPPPPDDRRREDAVVPARPGMETRVERPPPNRPRPDPGNPGN